MADSKIAVVYEGSFGQSDGQSLVLDRWRSTIFVPTHNDRLERTNTLIEKMHALSAGAVGAELADCNDMPECGTGQQPRRKSDKERLAQGRAFIFGPVTQACGMLLIKSAIDLAASTGNDDDMPVLLDTDNWVDVAFAQKDADNDYVHYPDEDVPMHSDWFAAMTGEQDPDMQQQMLGIVCRAVVDLPDFSRPQQLAYRGALATFYRFDNTPTPFEA
jgi:hypothetical protein